MLGAHVPSTTERFPDERRREYERAQKATCGKLALEVRALAPLRMPRRVLEVGCGHGHFLTAYAAAHPEAACVGVDYCRERIRRAGRKLARLGLPNLCFVRAEARAFFAILDAAIEFEKVFILFPDPWPKRRHRKNRLLSESFLECLANRVVPGGQLCFRTDHADYFEEVRRLADELPYWQGDLDSPWEFDHDTVFQQKARAHRSLTAIRL